MRAYVHTLGGSPWNEECAAAQRGFEKLEIECVPFSSNDVLDCSNRADVVVGGMLVVGHRLAQLGVDPPAIEYPSCLESFLGRKIWIARVRDIGEPDLTLFAKPLNEKQVPGGIVSSHEDLAPFAQFGADYELLCSEPVEFVSEWRCFVRYGELLGTRHYNGNRLAESDKEVVAKAISAYKGAPAGYGIDFGVTSDGRTLIVEVNDGYAIGSYGLRDEAYSLMLSARWAELVGVHDELAGRELRG